MMQNRSEQGAPNDLVYGRGVTENRKCLETGKRPNPLWDKTVPDRGAQNDFVYGRGFTENGKCLETGKQPNPL